MEGRKVAPAALVISRLIDQTMTKNVDVMKQAELHDMINAPLAASLRYGPMMMSGHIASIAPYHLTAFDGVTDYWLDITCDRGLSGGPIRNVDGEVIGMLTSGPMFDLSKIAPDLLIPQGVARALPLNERLVADMRTECEKKDLSTVK